MASSTVCGGREGGPNRCPTPLAIRKPNPNGRMYLMTPEERRLLELLAESAEGCTDALLTAHGYELDVHRSFIDAAHPAPRQAVPTPVRRACDLGRIYRLGS